MPIAIPTGVTVEVGERNEVKVTGPNGELSRPLHRAMSIEVGDEEVAQGPARPDPLSAGEHGDRCNRRL
jgi:ribosomal protein L6P/L9E